MVTSFLITIWYIAFMPFVPTEKQIDSLHTLLRQLRREKIEIRVIRFNTWTHKNDIANCEIEVCCLEDEDRYIIYYNGKMVQD